MEFGACIIRKKRGGGATRPAFPRRTRRARARVAGAEARPRVDMSLFAPFRALGLVSSPSGVPFVVKRRGTESWVTVACEDSFAVYDCRKLTLTFHGARFNGIHVAALAVRKDWTFLRRGEGGAVRAAVARDVRAVGTDGTRPRDCGITRVRASLGEHRCGR